MDKFKLTDEEGHTLDAIAELLRTLPTSSQYNVLRNMAHLMSREVVNIGAVRAAAAVAGSVARVMVSKKPEKDTPKGSGPTTRSSKKGGYSAEFLADSSIAPLLKEKVAAKDALSQPPTEAEKTRLREASKALREAWCGWRV